MKPSDYLREQTLRLQVLEEFAERERPEFRQAVRSLGNGIAAAVASELAKWNEVLKEMAEARGGEETS